MVLFSLSEQSFYSVDCDPSFIPSDVVEVSDVKHYQLLQSINAGCLILTDLTATLPRPSEYHVYEDGQWIDMRSEGEKRKAFLESLPALTRRRFMLILAKNGLDTIIETFIDRIPDPLKRKSVLIEYRDATEFERTNPTVLLMVSLLQLTEAQVDAMWLEALTY